MFVSEIKVYCWLTASLLKNTLQTLKSNLASVSMVLNFRKTLLQIASRNVSVCNRATGISPGHSRSSMRHVLL